MTKNEIIGTLNKYPSMQLATVDGSGAPRTRGIFMYSADESGILFHTGSFRELYQQLLSNPRVEASFLDTERTIQIRVSGEAGEIDDAELRDKIITTPGREFLKPTIAKFGKEAIRIFKIGGCRASVWSMQTNTQYPKEEIVF